MTASRHRHGGSARRRRQGTVAHADQPRDGRPGGTDAPDRQERDRIANPSIMGWMNAVEMIAPTIAKPLGWAEICDRHPKRMGLSRRGRTSVRWADPIGKGGRSSSIAQGGIAAGQLVES
jgi:hypothetical protein